MCDRLVMRRDGTRAWLLSDSATGADVGGIEYVHAADGNHYRAWVIVSGIQRDADGPVSQLAMAALAVETGFKDGLPKADTKPVD